MYQTFFSELNEARKEIGDEEFADWCFSELRISLSICTNVARVLKAADAARVQMDLSAAKKAEQQAKKAEADQRKREREEAHERAGTARKEREEAAERAAKDNRNKKRQQDRDAKRRQLATLPPFGDVLPQLLKQAEGVEAMTRVELGKLYYAMREEVGHRRAGKDERDEYWVWTKWAAMYIKDRGLRSVQQCISDYETTLLNAQGLRVEHSENVIQLHKNTA